MKRSEILFGLLKIPIDSLAVLGGLILAYRLRVASIDLVPNFQLLGPPQLPAFAYYLQSFALPVTGLFIALAGVSGLYALKITLSAWREVGRIVYVSGLWLGLIVSWFFLVQRQLFFSRILLVHAVILVTVLVLVGRGIVTLIQRWGLRRGIGVRRVLSLGTHPLSDVLKRMLVADERYDYRGHVKSVHSLMHEEHHRSIDLVLHTDPNPGSDETVHLINHCRSRHIGYAFLPPVFADVPHQLTISRLGMVPLLQFKPTPLDGWGRVCKRLFDLVVGLLLLIVLLPLLLLVACVMLLVDGWPLFYVSPRVGQRGVRLVPVLKLRTMQRDADERKASLQTLSHRRDGPLFKIRFDPRVTRLGRILRRLSIDELPQLLNVIAGHLSLVGPRPHLPDEVARYTEDQRRVLAVKPGITGLAQVSGRSNLTFDDEVRLDMRYVEEWSLLLDLWILWRTVIVVLWGQGAD